MIQPIRPSKSSLGKRKKTPPGIAGFFGGGISRLNLSIPERKEDMCHYIQRLIWQQGSWHWDFRPILVKLVKPPTNQSL